MDVKSFPSGRTPSQELRIMNSSLSGPTHKKKQNFIIQESITINKGKITSSYTASTKSVNRSTSSNVSQNVMKDKNLLQGLKASLNRKISESNKPKIMTTVIPNKMNTNKKLEVPSTSNKSYSTEVNRKMNQTTKETTDKHSTSVDFEDVIPTTTTKKNAPGLAMSSEVSLFPAVNNFQKQNSSNVNIPVRKKTKKKKRRFRNMDGSEDEDDWPTPVITYTKVNPASKTTSTHASTSYVTPTRSPTIPTTPKRKEKIQILQEYIFPSPHSQIRTSLTPKKVENVERLDKCNLDKDDDHLSDDSVSSIHSKISAISDFNLNGSANMNESLGEDTLEINEGAAEQENVVFQITEDGDEMEPQPGEIFCAYDDEGNLICLQKTETGELVMIPAEAIVGDENTDETPGMNPADDVNLNNNSFEVESKEDLQMQQEKIIKADETDNFDKLEDELLQSSPDNSVKDLDVIDEALLLSEEDPKVPEVVSAEASVKDAVPREDDDSPGILVDTVENVGNEEIISESHTPPEDVVTLPSPNQADEVNEPIYILNETEQQEVTSIHNATPLELAFITTLQSFAESATILPESTKRGKAKTKTPKGKKAGKIIEPVPALVEPQQEVILNQLETLLKKQNQCSIVDYVPADKSDEDQLDDSMNSVDNLSQMDIAKMVLGEGFGVRLVSDQAEAVDLLQLPPEYEQKPLVSVSIAPLIHSEDDSIETDDKKPRVAAPLKQKRPSNKKVNATSTPMAKSPKKKTYTIKHVTGDCNEGREVELHKVDKPAKSVKGKKPLAGLGKGKVAGSPGKKIQAIKKRRQNGSLTLNSTTLSECLEPPSSIDDKLSATSLVGEMSQADGESTDQSQTSILSPIAPGGVDKIKKLKKKKRGRRKNIDKKPDDNNSSKENDSSVNDNASQLGDSTEDSSAFLKDAEIKREVIYGEESINSKDDTNNEDISLGSTSALSSEESDNFEIKNKPRVKKKKIVTPLIEARTTRSATRSTLPKSISQSDLVNAEVSISLTEGYAKKEEVDDDVVLIDKPAEAPIDVDAHVEKVPTDDTFKEPESSSNESKLDETTATPNGDVSNSTNNNRPHKNDKNLKSTPKSSKKSLPFKINFKTLMNNASPANKKHKHKKSPKNKNKDKDRSNDSDIQFDADIQIKDEPIDHDVDAQPKVPKIILKISPHASPSIVRSPSASPKKSAKGQDKMDTPQNKSKKEIKKRKMFSPAVSSETDSPKRKKKKVSKEINGLENGDDLNNAKEDLNKSVPQATDDPELLINLPDASVNDLNAEVKVEVKKENENEEPPGPDPYKVGDLVLARFSNYCYWPCMVTLEPAKQAYWRPSYSVVAYHVRFFGDNGRRAWVHGTNIIPCSDGLQTLENHAKVLEEKKKFASTDLKNKLNRDIAACKVNNRIRSSWNRGMCELLSLVSNTVAERHEFFFEMFATSREKKRKRQMTESEDTSSDVKQEIESIEVKEEPLDKPAVKKRKLDKKPATPKVEKAKKPEGLAAAKLGDRRRSVRSNKSTPSSSSNTKVTESPKENEKDSNINNEKSNYVIEDLELIIKGSLEMQGDDGMKREEEGEVKNENKEEEVGKRTRQWRTKKTGDESKKTAEESKKIEKSDSNEKNKPSGDGASEVSDTDSSSKISVQSSGHKRVLFKDVSRSPVCHVCFNAGGTVVKCKGKCCGFYHPECSQLKAEPKNEEEHPPVFASPSTTKSPKTPQNSPPNVEIISHKKKAKYLEKDEVNLNDSDVAPHMNLMDQLDNKLSKVMAPIVASTIYRGSTTDDATSEDDVQIYDVDEINENKPVAENLTDFMCIACKHNVEPPCFACGSTVFLKEHVERFRCSINGCGKYFHKECLTGWPQAVISNDESFRFKCPMHACQTCTSENPKASTSLLPMSKMVRCLKCPATYDSNSFCIPAGTEILSNSQIICPRHVQHKTVKRYTINANWCFICSRGGDLMCCETCPTSVHSECISINLRPDDTFVCEDCESGRLPLYDEIVWAKFAHYKWWPAVILFPEDIPENVRNFPHKTGEFVVRFYGTHDHHWFALGRVFLFQEDDKDGDTTPAHKRDFNFQKAVDEAKTALIFKKQLKLQRDLARRKSEKPPPFTKIRINRVVGNLKPSDLNISNTNACTCREDMLNPCGPDSDCLNRLLLTECDPDVCPSKDKCQNQRFEKRIYPPLVAYKTDTRGWGLKSIEPIFKGQFVIEYVGEVIDQEEYQRRMTRMNQQKAENYYFLTLDSNRTIDAGPKGNLARFMNHCCKPNCETQKWTVKGDTRVGLFASQDIAANTELTFNYHMETIGDRKEVCRCGAENCSGFLGVKNKEAAKPAKPVTKIKKKAKKISTFKKSEAQVVETKAVPCFICEEGDADVECTMKNCGKVYHVKCLDVVPPPQGKWTCPRHYCNTCAKRTIRSCYKCLESYCPMHSQGNINFHRAINYYVCNKHNPDATSPTVSTSDSVSTTTSSSQVKLDAS